MITSYEERLLELDEKLQTKSYYISVENLATDRPLTKTETGNISDTSRYFVYRINSGSDSRPYKRRIFVHMRSYYMPNILRGMTDVIKNIWVNAKEYYKKLVLRHEKIHVAHPEWSEEVVREFDEFYEPFLPDVEWVYV